MLRRIFAMMLSGILMLTAFGFTQVRAQMGNDTQAVNKVRDGVQKIGIGPRARVEVKLQDGTRLKGYLSSADQNSFTLTDKTGSTRTVSYREAATVKKTGNGLSTKSWIILGAAAVGAVVTWVIVKPAVCDGGAQSRFPC